MITYVNFLSKFKMVLNKGSSIEAPALRLLNFKQAKRSMSDYSIDFWILAEVTCWGPEAFRSALELNDELIVRDVPASFDELMSLCIKVDGQLHACQTPWNDSSHEAVGQLGAGSSAEHGPFRAPEGADRGELMQTGSSHLAAAERQHRISAGELRKRSCPPVRVGVLVGELSHNKSPPHLTLPAKISVHTECHSLSVLIDSRTEQNFID